MTGSENLSQLQGKMLTKLSSCKEVLFWLLGIERGSPKQGIHWKGTVIAVSK